MANYTDSPDTTQFRELSNSRFFGWFALVNTGVVATLAVSSSLLGASPEAMGPLLLIAVTLGCGGAFVSLALSSWFATRAHGLQRIDELTDHKYAWLVNDVADLSRKAGLQHAPQVGIWSGPDLNAFATGRSRSSALVAFSEPLLETMTREEARAIAAHEIAHIANRDMLAMTLLQGVVNTFVLMAIIPIQFGRLFNYFSNSFSFAFEIVAVVLKFLLAAVLTFIGSLFVKAFSRRREFRADAMAAKLVSPRSMKSALKRLAANGPTEKPTQVQAAFAALKINGGGIAEFLSTHPSIEKRIRALDEGA